MHRVKEGTARGVHAAAKVYGRSATKASLNLAIRPEDDV
jgi:hypothetical protein